MNKDWVLISDCDGIFTTSCFTYSKDGKVQKSFSPNDGHVAKLLIPHLSDFKIITGDRDQGYDISLRRMEDIELADKMLHVASKDKLNWIKDRYDISKVAYFGDDVFDLLIFKECGFSACPSSALPILQDSVNYISPQRGGEDAFADMALYFSTHFLNINIETLLNDI